MAIRVVDRKVSLSLSLFLHLCSEKWSIKVLSFFFYLFVPILHAYDCAHRLYFQEILWICKYKISSLSQSIRALCVSFTMRDPEGKLHLQIIFLRPAAVNF